MGRARSMRVMVFVPGGSPNRIPAPIAPRHPESKPKLEQNPGPEPKSQLEQDPGPELKPD